MLSEPIGQAGQETLEHEVMNALPAHVAVLDRVGRIAWVNEAWRRFARENGCDPDLVGTGCNYIDACRNALLRGDTVAAEAMEGLEKVLRGEANQFTCEYPCHSPHEERWYAMQAVTRQVHGGAVIVHTDITRFYRSEAALQEAEDHFRHMVELSPQLPWTADPSGKILDLSPKWFSMSGYTPEQTLGEAWLKVVHPEDRPLVEQAWGQCIRNVTDFDFEFRVCLSNGTTRWMRSRAFPRRDPSGRIVRWYGATEDVHERHIAQDALVATAEHARTILDNTLNFVGVLDLEGTVLEANLTALKAGGLSRGDVIGRKFWDCAWWSYDPAVQEQLQQAIKRGIQGEIVRYDVVVRMAGDVRMPIDFMLAPARDERGRITHLIPSGVDITQRKEAEQTLLLQARVIDSMTEGVSVADENGLIIYTNPAEDRLFGYERGELIGRHVTTQNDYSEEENEQTVAAVIGQLKTSGFWSGEWRNRRKDGTPFFTQSTITRLDLEHSSCFVCVQRDITEWRLAQAALRESEERFRAMANAMPQLVWTARDNGRVDYYNSRLTEYGGILNVPGGQWDWQPVVHPEDVERTLECWKRSVADRSLYQCEHRVRMADGSYRWHLSRAIPVAGSGSAVKWYGTATDIDAQKRTEMLLRDSEERFRVAANSLNPALVIYDRERRFQFMNESGLNWIGRSFTELAGRTDEEVFPETVTESYLPVLKRVAETKLPASVEFKIALPRTGPTDFRFMYCRYAPVLDDQQGLRQIVALVEDVTNRRKAQHALQLSEERFRKIFENAATGIAITDFDGRFLQCNRAYCQMVQYSESELRSMQMSALVFSGDVEQLSRQTSRLCNQEITSFEVESRYISKTGSTIWVRKFVSLLGERETEKSSIVAMVTDMTQRRRAEEALKESEERFRAMADGTPIVIWVHDATGALKFINRAYCEFFGVTAEQVLGPNWKPLVHAEDVSGYVDAFVECHLQRKPFLAQARVRAANEQWRWIESCGQPRFSASGEYLGMAGSSLDITERKEFQAELERVVQERTAELKETTDQLNSFVYTLAHDLRAPLRAQLAFATILLEDFGPNLGKTGTDYARRIAEAAERQGNLLADLLKHISLSRADLPMENVDLLQIIKQAQADLIMEVQQKGAVIKVGPIAGRVQGNPASLHLIFSNLLSNAIKFVPPGVNPEIRVWSEPLADAGECSSPSSSSKPASLIRIWVEDNGIGIRQEHMGKLFQVFQRLHSGSLYPGTGIGLAIVKKAAERMGGRVGVQSEPGQGSRFWVDLQIPTA